MKKALGITLAAVMALSLGVSLVNAAPPSTSVDSKNGQPIALTASQREEVAPLFKQMFELKKQILQKFVTDGVITQADADQRAARMQDRMNDRLENGLIGQGMHRDSRMGNGHGRGTGAGYRAMQQTNQ